MALRYGRHYTDAIGDVEEGLKCKSLEGRERNDKANEDWMFKLLDLKGRIFFWTVARQYRTIQWRKRDQRPPEAPASVVGSV
jgi:hypothetical protein